MKRLGLFASIILLSFSLTIHADAFDDEFNGMNSTMDELDMETGSCITEIKVQTERATKMLALLKKKKSKIASLEVKVDSLTTQLINRSNVQVCDTSGLNQQVTGFQLNNAQLKRENAALKLKVAKLQSELILGRLSKPSRRPTLIARPVTLPTDSAIEIEETVDADWTTNSKDFANRLGQDFAYICPPKGSVERVYGGVTNKYQTSSSVCTAAVHAGLMTVKSGGQVIIRIITNKNGYKGSYRNDIQSSNTYNTKGFIFLN